MEYIDFKRLIDALTAKPKETEWLEFKHNFHSKEEIGERISALSNSAYLSNMPFGYIVFGIDDESHNVIGTDLYGKQKMVGNEELESWLSTRLNPRIDFEIIDDFDYEANGHVCIFKIPATTNRPVSFLHESYIRVGTITRKLKDFPAKEAKIWKGGQKPLEKIVLKKGLSGQDVFSFLSAEVYFDMMNLPLPQDIISSPTSSRFSIFLSRITLRTRINRMVVRFFTSAVSITKARHAPNSPPLTESLTTARLKSSTNVWLRPIYI